MHDAESGTTPVITHTRGYDPMYGIWFATSQSCPRFSQLLHEIYSQHARSMTHDGLKLEARVKEEIGADPNGNIVLADAIRCQQQYGLPLFNGSDSSIVVSSSFLML